MIEVTDSVLFNNFETNGYVVGQLDNVAVKNPSRIGVIENNHLNSNMRDD